MNTPRFFSIILFLVLLAVPAYGQECAQRVADTASFVTAARAEALTMSMEKQGLDIHTTAIGKFLCGVYASPFQAAKAGQHAEGVLLRYELARWENEAWQPSVATSLEYDNNGLLTATSAQAWVDNVWVEVGQSVSENDEQGQQLSSTRLQWDGTSWQNERRVLFRWNEQGEMIEEINEDWVDGAWVTRYRRVLTYENGLLVAEHLENYTEQGWVQFARFMQEFDDQGRRVFWETELFDNASAEWFSGARATVAYGENDADEINEYWDVSRREWIFSLRMKSEFDADGKPLEVTLLDWNGSDWIIRNRVVSIYNEAGFLVEQHVEIIEGGEWKRIGNNTMTHDEQGNVLTRLRQNWDADQNALVNVTLSTYTFGEPTSVSIEDNEVHSLASIDLYPMPARDRVRFDITLEEPATITIAVFDLSGRQVARLSAEAPGVGVQPIVWEPWALAAGTYLVRIKAAGWLEHRTVVLVK